MVLGRARGDAALVRAAQGGSGEAVEELFARHWPGAHRAALAGRARRAAAEDIAQEAFLAALRALDRFDRRRPLRGRGCTGSSSTARSTTRAPGRCGARSVPTRSREPAAPSRPDGSDGELLRRARRAAGPSSAPSSSCATCSATRRARSPRMLELPRGTVNSRLRRGLDALARAAGGGAP